MEMQDKLLRESLTKTLDDLASRAMMVEDNPEQTAPLFAALSDIAGQAEAGGYPTFSQVALEISKDSGGEALRQGLLRLQAILEEPSTPTPKLTFSALADPELLREFIVEARDHLGTVETQVLTLEQDPGNTDAVHAIFRGFHTIKGVAGFLELDAIQAVAHETETLLDLVRNGKLVVTPAMVDVILAAADYLKTEVARIEAILAGNPAGEAAPHAALVERVHAMMSAHTPGGSVEQQPTQAPATPLPEAADDFKVVLPEAPPAATAEESVAAEAAMRDARKAPESRIVKVDTAKLDFLVDMVGELVIAQSMIRHDGELNSVANPHLQRNLAQLSRITGEVQKTAMSMRMVPIGQLFQKSVRLVRDLTRKSGKRAEVDISGEDTELDRNIVEDLSDPLVHMIRNAADHGIETPEERVRAGKNPTGRIGLKAYHQAGHIVIEVSDDGRGLRREKLLKKAIERGLVQDGSNLSDKEVFGLIFEPGFSTAEKVTDVSGRGVGMDVVRKQVQKMRGRVEIESRPEQGTTFFMKLPLTLAIIDGLVVGVGQERYIVPIFAVREIFRPLPDTVFTVENRHEMVMVRGNLLPVVRLYERFSVKARSTEVAESVMVVAESGGKRFCLMVDELIGKQEVVIKSLGETFKQVNGVAGGAILGDGRVGLIIEMEGVFSEASHG